MTKKNDNFQTVAGVLKEASSVLLYPHISPDGDAIGSTVAMARVLRQLGKTCYVVTEDEIPENLQFLDHGYTMPIGEVSDVPTVSMCIDCGEDGRYPKRANWFHQAPISICVDHHPTTEPVFDYNIIDPSAAAAAELIYHLIRALDHPIDRETAEALYTGINTDTGRFQYSNTTAQTHRIAADLIDCGVDVNRMNVELYESQRPERMRIEAQVMNNMKLSADGKFAMAYVTRAMMEENDVRSGDTDAVVANLRSIRGVEVAAFFKEKADDAIKLSLRAKGNCDVAAIAMAFGGGGHRKASGATLTMSLQEAIDAVTEKVLKSIADEE